MYACFARPGNILNDVGRIFCAAYNDSGRLHVKSRFSFVVGKQAPESAHQHSEAYKPVSLIGVEQTIRRIFE
jgi:hypothetical protein